MLISFDEIFITVNFRLVGEPNGLRFVRNFYSGKTKMTTDGSGD